MTYRAASKEDLRKIAQELMGPLIAEVDRQLAEAREERRQLLKTVQANRREVTELSERQETFENKVRGQARQIHEHIAKLENAL